MAGCRPWMVGVFLALLLVGGACGGDADGDQTSRTPTPSTTPPSTQAAAPPGLPPGAPDLAQMIETITKQLEQATAGPGGTPQPVNADEVSALLKAHMEQYLNQTKSSGTGDGK